MSKMTLGLFEHGQTVATRHDLILADTKYEFGRGPNGLMVIDEVNTPDSSRYFLAYQYQAYQRGETTTRPTQLSKEFAREWAVAQGFTGADDQEAPHMPDDIRDEVTDRYIELYERMLYRLFVPAREATEGAIQDRIYANVTGFLLQNA
jgi:phosphoribosylaminoimidazole-succinocarboxamide synthase